MSKDSRVIIWSYVTFAAIAVLGRWLFMENDFSIFPSGSLSWMGTIMVVWIGLLFPVVMFGPSVIAVLMVRRWWPGNDRKIIWQSWIPATFISVLVATVYWFFLFADSVTWAEFFTTFNYSYLWSVGCWLLGTLLILFIDHWLHTPKNKIDNKGKKK